jgi:hypothetical protein
MTTTTWATTIIFTSAKTRQQTIYKTTKHEGLTCKAESVEKKRKERTPERARGKKWERKDRQKAGSFSEKQDDAFTWSEMLSSAQWTPNNWKKKNQ